MLTSQFILEKGQFLNNLDIQAYYKQMQSSSIVMSYKGAASNDLLTSLLSIAQTKLAETESKSAIKKRVFSILVEILQNIYHHYEAVHGNSLHEDDAITFLLVKLDDTYTIITGNYVASKDVMMLKQRIDEVNSLTADELKEKYREQLNIGVVSPKGGAGLGIIDIARKSGNRLEYEFEEFDPHYSFFSLTVRISAN
ncbi:hypothetical protein SAMN04488541_1005108 [Thermoflexibacter ruber]|uniref:Uncharacterized protein n=1 Tax=Thermoflexibacter ruber TaxID=1003 RepID=A0A1I2CQ56_9BACT|nr:hypothetical protein SAMN04488541_1005108 [Thermoflexibacter ruber]